MHFDMSEVSALAWSDQALFVRLKLTFANRLVVDAYAHCLDRMDIRNQDYHEPTDAEVTHSFS